MRHDGAPSGQRGQGTVEWIGLVLCCVLVLLGVLTLARGRLPGASLAEALAAKLICAAGLGDSCAVASQSALVATYGPELASTVEAHAPEIRYEDGMRALPVDFRSCRAARCGGGPSEGEISRSDTGEPVVMFVHAVDCRPDAIAAAESRGFDCAGQRAGHLYLQYWAYYQDSATSRALLGAAGYHADDWEGYQLRIGTDGTDARATSHHGYDYGGGPLNWPSDLGVTHHAAWGPATGDYYVSGGSHAGHVYEPRRISERRVVRLAGGVGEGVAENARWALTGTRPGPPPRLPRRLTYRPPPSRWTSPDGIVLIPIESLTPAELRTRFAITPPWRKPVYRDPEGEGT